MSSLTASEIARLKTFWARTGVAASLLHSRTTLPLTYPLNSASNAHLMSNLNDNSDEIQNRLAFKSKDCAQCLAHMKPVLVGLSHLAPVLKGLNSLDWYHGFGKTHGMDNGVNGFKRKNLEHDSVKNNIENDVSASNSESDPNSTELSAQSQQLSTMRRTARIIRREQLNPRTRTRLDFVRPQNLRRMRRQSYVGLGTGWDEYGSGRPADSWKNRMVTEL